MSLEFDFFGGMLLLSATSMTATVAITLGVLRVVRRQRTLETLWRLRLARWRHETGHLEA